MEAVLETARACARMDVNDATRAATHTLIDNYTRAKEQLNAASTSSPADAAAVAAASAARAGAEAALRAAFGSRMAFGTAGLRADMGVGTARMNQLSIVQAAQGLVAYLLATHGEAEAQRRGLVIGFDHRAGPYGITSESMAYVTAAAAVAKGLRVYLFHGLVCTPMVPFTVARVGAVAGVMVTASHNPKQDDGYKVYGDNGAQIVSPVDKHIADAILRNLEPWPEAQYANVTEESIRASPLCSDVDFTRKMVDEYVAEASSRLCARREANASAPLRVSYTAMHGVGTPFATRMFAAFNLPAFFPTPEQCSPDPEFPTVAFPNPEEGAGALALAMANADRHNCSLILANDPDADRLAVAERIPGSTAAGAAGWKVFTGNEIGALLAHWQWTKYLAAGGDPKKAWMVASTVSSRFLATMAAKEGFHFEEVLTGFKYMGNSMAKHRANGDEVIFSFEEAIGFCCSDVVRDKDGVVSSAVFAEMANDVWRSTGRTMVQHLTWLYEKYGYFITNNYYVVVDDPAKTNTIFARLRNEGHYWAKLGDLRISGIRDLTGVGWDSEQPDGKPLLPTSSGSHMITYKFANGVTATLRTSGTEPKLKYYCELSGAEPEAVRKELNRTVNLILDEMLQPERYGLTRGRKD